MPARMIRRTLAVLAVTIAAIGLAAVPAAADTADTAAPGDSAWSALADTHATVKTILSPADSAW